MGKVIIVKQKPPVEEIQKTGKTKAKELCRNCGNQILKRVTGEGFCCKACKEEFETRYHPPKKRPTFDTSSLPYNAYTPDKSQVEKFNARYNDNEK